MGVTAVYFSPTGNTKRSVEAMAAALDPGYKTVDLTLPSDTGVSCQFGPEDLVIIGMPVYAGRIPMVAVPRLSGLKGNGTPCILVATYGNRHYDDALVEMEDIAREHGFAVRGAAALVGRHTYGEIQTERPDGEDLKADAEFAKRAAASEAMKSTIPGSRPYKKEAVPGGKFKPLTSDACVGCGICASHCRFNALEKEEGRYRVNEYACEGCGVCAYVCPQKAVYLAEDVAGRKELYLGERIFSTAVLKMGRGNSGKLVTDVKMAMLKHAPETELAIIDGSPGIGCPVIASVSGMDLVLIVAEPSQSGISDLKRLVKTARTFQASLAVCVNKWDVSPEHARDIKEFCKEEDIPFAGVIPYDKNVSLAVNAGKSIADIDCPARDALKNIFETVNQILKKDEKGVR